MDTNSLRRQEIIQNRASLLDTESVADTAVLLWALMAGKIVAIVGESGFNSLYARSIFLAQPTFPWLAAGTRALPTPPPGDHRFADLKTKLEGQTAADARAANHLLLITFTDILASLIGEELTASILRSAWGSDASQWAAKESKNG